ncbi:PIR Superfamily Protein [Plasmodium ovale wallikeri]|uniref:PIR Superfamily Protein n=1 Tax=Plasmodium ovale wallikeri TaxID=864142 RepID=A0A1A9AH62_PLAOA|nr:PIR Superfamily Protein [Plasmodium ovale wallikeri]
MIRHLILLYTPLGSKIHASFRNNEDISINKDYEATNEMLSNISKSNDLYSENMQYNFTPFGPFLRAKINRVKDRWMNTDTNVDELLPLSTDIEDNISDYGEYNIGYYSETN